MQKLLGFVFVYLLIGLVYGLYRYFFTELGDFGFFSTVLLHMVLWPIYMFPGVFKLIGGLIVIIVFAMAVLS